MARNSTHAGWKQIDRLFEAGSLVGLTDRQLLERFLAGEAAEAAFEALVDRHGPMVRAVCRSMLGDPRRGRRRLPGHVPGPGPPGRLDPPPATRWAAGSTASPAGSRRGPGRRRPPPARSSATSPSGHAASRRGRAAGRADARAARGGRAAARALPGPDRALLPGGPVARAGRRALGCPMRTVETRLQRGKAKLRTRLVRRGLAPAAGLLAIGVESAEAAPAVLAGSVPPALSESTARASVQFAASPGRRARHDRRSAWPRASSGPSSGTDSGAGGAGVRPVAGPGPDLLRHRRGRPEARQAGGDDQRPHPRRPGPAHPRRRGLDADLVR